MFWRILKKDLKRKKTMNLILLLFVIICSMFAAAAVNNIVAVTGGIEHYFRLSEVPDMTLTMPDGCDAEERIRALPSVSEIRTEQHLMIISSKNFRYDGKQLDNFVNPAVLISDTNMAIRYFDDTNHVIGQVEPGHFYCTSQFLKDTDIQPGDTVELEIGDTKMKLILSGRFKAAIYSTEDLANTYMILNHEDYKTLGEDPEIKAISEFVTPAFFIYTSDPAAVQEIAAEYADIDVMTRANYKDIYLYDLVSAYILMAISVILMITALIVLRFTIGFTISEEFREIGVMKAVGIDNGSIRFLYIAKYLAISAVGAAIGFAGSLPLSSAMLQTVSRNMVLGSENGWLLGLCSSLAVVVLILLFCYGCTRTVNKLSPIDAVRSGQTGERFSRKSLLHLGRSRLPATGFLSLNDVCSAPKRFALITVIFSLCILMMTMMSNFALTLKSETLMPLFPFAKSEIHILDTNQIAEVAADWHNYRKVLDDTQAVLEKNDIPGTCSVTAIARCEVARGDKKTKLMFEWLLGDGEPTTVCEVGSMPQRDDEAAMTRYSLNALGAEVGDRFTAVIDGEEREFLITGMYSSFDGSSVRLHSGYDAGNQQILGCNGIQIDLDGDQDAKTVNGYIETLRDKLHTDQVYSTSEFIKTMTNMSDTLNTVKRLMMVLTVIVTALIVILMERSFISKEKSEIALMKAVGIGNFSIIGQHTLRFAVVSILACGLAFVVLMPASDVIMSWVCSMIGSVSHVHCVIDPAEVFAVCPAILISVTVLGAFLTALYTMTIKASDTASIE